MEAIKEAALTQTGQNGKKYTYKTSEYNPKRQVKLLFLSGRKLTAREINQEIGFNDARKVISDLRHKEGWNIKDIYQNDGCKLYWLEPNNQPTLFDKEVQDV